MRYEEIPAAPPLDRWVRCFWFLEVEGGGPRPVVPDGRVEIVLHRAEPFVRVHPDGVARAQETALVSGQLTRPIRVGPDGPSDVVGVRFRTAGARAVLGTPLDGLTDDVVPLREVDRALGSALETALRAADPVTALSRVLLERARWRTRPTTAAAVGRLARGEAVAAVAASVGISERSLERHVRADVGLPPKRLQRLIRFRDLYARLERGEEAAAASLAAGYYDQSHANLDFRAFAGCSPGEHFGVEDELAGAFLSGPS